ncbi:MAG: hypothetical protein AUK36_07270 [Zetaproteobacteria bacterium CG2_30_59_37]|nr:MAG: hypothetical protein AUK36_07270 [Zetaproteobacteria bacterium CG2_30_59_37]
MRHLLLIRHAKSDWGDASLSDFDRPLNVRGECDAPMMGDRLAANGPRIDRMISSPARRARSTAEAIARSISFPAHEIDLMTELYLASPALMQDVIRSCPDNIGALALVGHNPGISALASQLCEKNLGEIPTCAIVHLCCKAASWSEATRFELVDFDHPKKQD